MFEIVNVAWNAICETSTLDVAYMSDCMHERTSKMWWDTIVFKPKLQIYAKFNRALGQKTKYWVICQDTSAQLSQFRAGTLPLHFEQIDWLTLHSKKGVASCVLMNVLRMNFILFVCVCFIRMKEFC